MRKRRQLGVIILHFCSEALKLCAYTAGPVATATLYTQRQKHRETTMARKRVVIIPN